MNNNQTDTTMLATAILEAVSALRDIQKQLRITNLIALALHGEIIAGDADGTDIDHAARDALTHITEEETRERMGDYANLLVRRLRPEIAALLGIATHHDRKKEGQ